MPNRILLAGYYGFGNLGDEILLETYRSQLSPKFMVDVLPANRWNFPKILFLLLKCDVLLFGGGGILQDQTGTLGLWFYLALIFMARLFGKKIVLLGQGAGPLAPFNLNLTCLVLSMADKITVRDKESLALLTGVNATLSADSSLLWKPPLAVRKPSGEKRVVFIPREEDPSFHDALQKARQSAEKMGAKFEVLAKVPPAQAAERLAGAALIISMRLHGLILAEILGVPSQPALNSPKINSWLKDRDLKGLRKRAETDFEWLKSL
ncbi:MAG: hypothetical protein A2901_07905 [Elusimicrobia bacterium RIFCSPLOWO2_01_FULL_54_10]|nr:MAG: hypothetical protein A2901_07905 [Elusimicrobia bacterium RIFCSPLOWO2_01_FULL_54_10]